LLTAETKKAIDDVGSAASKAILPGFVNHALQSDLSPFTTRG
jgi:hypothetical protein